MDEKDKLRSSPPVETTRREPDLSGEDLSRGPTPETRHPAGHVEGKDFAEGDSVVGETGGVNDVRDTTQGPTPEIRQVMRATKDDASAAGQPGSDERTRANVGGNQDVELTKPVDRDRDRDVVDRDRDAIDRDRDVIDRDRSRDDINR